MQSLSALAGELSAPGLRDLAADHHSLPRTDEEWRQYRYFQNEILDKAWDQAVESLSNTLDPEPAPAMQEQLVRIKVDWDRSYAPYGCKPPPTYILIPHELWEEGVRDEDVVREHLEDEYGGWYVESWFATNPPRTW